MEILQIMLPNPPFNKSFIEPQDLKPSAYYSNAISVKGGRTIYVSGQTCYDENHSFIPGDFSQQIDQSLKNLQKVLHTAGASPSDVVMIHLYIKNYRQHEHLNILMDKLKKFFTDGKMPASTLIGVQSLARDELLFEIEAIAVVPE